MERKYQIISASNLMKVAVKFSTGFATISMNVDVDFDENRVYFNLDKEAWKDLDLDDLEQEILAYLRPVGPEMPKFSSEIFQKIFDVQSGKYGSEKYGELQ